MSTKIKGWLKNKIDSCFWIDSDRLKNDIIARIEIKPFQDLVCNFKETEVNESYRADNNKWIHKEEVIKIVEPSVIEPVYANILFKFNCIFSKSVFYTALKPSVLKYVKSIFLSRFIKIEESIIFDGGAGTNYFHFFSDIFSKLWMLEKYNISSSIPLLIDNQTYHTKYFQYLLNNTQVSLYNWHVMKTHVKSKTTYLLRPLPYSFEYFNKTKNYLIKDIKKKQFPERIFLNRSVNSGRYIENFIEVEAVLKKYDFQIFDTNEMPLNEQISLFNGAKIIISIHGAGNTNIIFSEPGLKFLEINPDNRISCQYYWLSSVLNIEYNVILGGSLPFVRSYPEKGFTLDPMKLENYIEDLIRE